LRAFEAAARCGSFSAAAEELCVTQSAVSHQIRHLESWLGAPLFARGKGNRLKLLPHGTTLAQTLITSFAEIETACRRARRAEGPASLVIAAIPSIAVCWLIPRLADFRRQHPDIRLQLIYALHGQDVDFGEVDLALVFSKQGPPQIPGTHTTSFLAGASAPVCSPALAADLRRAGEEGLARAALLHDSGIGGWRQWFARAGKTPPEKLEGPLFEDFNLLRAAALAGQGLALCPIAMIAEDLRAGRLVQLSPITVHDDCGYYLVDRPPPGSTDREAAKAFQSWLFSVRDEAEAAARPAVDSFGAFMDHCDN